MFVKRECDENILLSKVRLSDIPCIDENQITAETSNDAWINKANELLAKIGNRITEWKKLSRKWKMLKSKEWWILYIKMMQIIWLKTWWTTS